MVSLLFVLVVLALVLAVAAATGKVPAWPALFVICVALLVMVWK